MKRHHNWDAWPDDVKEMILMADDRIQGAVANQDFSLGMFWRKVRDAAQAAAAEEFPEQVPVTEACPRDKLNAACHALDAQLRPIIMAYDNVKSVGVADGRLFIYVVEHRDGYPTTFQGFPVQVVVVGEIAALGES